LLASLACYLLPDHACYSSPVVQSTNSRQPFVHLREQSSIRTPKGINLQTIIAPLSALPGVLHGEEDGEALTSIRVHSMAHDSSLFAADLVMLSSPSPRQHTSGTAPYSDTPTSQPYVIVSLVSTSLA